MRLPDTPAPSKGLARPACEPETCTAHRRFFCVNPHTAALLVSLGLDLVQLMRLDSLNPLQVGSL